MWWHRRLVRRTSSNRISLALALALALVLAVALSLSLIVSLILTLSLAALVLSLSLACTIAIGVVAPVGGIPSASDASSVGELVGIPEDDDSADLASKGMRRQARLGALFGIGLDHEFRSLYTDSDLSLGEDDGLV